MKTVCIYHSIDLDGWMSAAIVKHWFNQQEIPIGRLYCSVCERTLPDDAAGSTECCGGITTVDNNTLDLIGYNYGQPIPDLREYDKVIMCDISFPVNEMEKIANKLTWIDHHISAIKQLDESKQFNSDILCRYTQVNYSACELTWFNFFPNEQIPEIVRLLGRYDCFGHKGTSEELKVLEFQYGARTAITDVESAYRYLNSSIKPNSEDFIKISALGEVIYYYLKHEARQYYKNGFEIFLNEPFYVGAKQMTNLRKFICINKERFNPINFGIDYHKDNYDGAACFHYQDRIWQFSLYNDNGLVDVSQIAKTYGGGGHKGAAGFRIANINDIIKLNNTL